MYSGTVLIVAVAVAITVVVYDTLPARIATTWDFQNNPVGYMQKTNYVIVILGYMIGAAILFMALDRLVVYRAFPVPLMSAIAGGMELFCLLMHLAILEVFDALNLSIFETILMLCSIPCLYVIVHMIFFRQNRDNRPMGLPLWIDIPPHSWWTRIFFFVRPILPHKVIAYDQGLVLRASLYAFTIPWKQIRMLTRATTIEALGAMAVRVPSAPSRSVKLSLKDAGLPVIFSIDNAARLIAEWERRCK
jgi:hypothetical protein